MNIPEAIKLQTQLTDLLPEVGFNKYIASTRLGIEAMKGIMKVRITFRPYVEALLPGETEGEVIISTFDEIKTAAEILAKEAEECL